MSDTSKDELLAYLRRQEQAWSGTIAVKRFGVWISEVEQSVRISDEEAASAERAIEALEHIVFYRNDGSAYEAASDVMHIRALLSRRTRSTKLGVENG